MMPNPGADKFIGNQMDRGGCPSGDPPGGSPDGESVPRMENYSLSGQVLSGRGLRRENSEFLQTVDIRFVTHFQELRTARVYPAGTFHRLPEKVFFQHFEIKPPWRQFRNPGRASLPCIGPIPERTGLINGPDSGVPFHLPDQLVGKFPGADFPPPSASTTARSMAEESSRIFPGQE